MTAKSGFKQKRLAHQEMSLENKEEIYVRYLDSNEYVWLKVNELKDFSNEDFKIGQIVQIKKMINNIETVINAEILIDPIVSI